MSSSLCVQLHMGCSESSWSSRGYGTTAEQPTLTTLLSSTVVFTLITTERDHLLIEIEMCGDLIAPCVILGLEIITY